MVITELASLLRFIQDFRCLIAYSASQLPSSWRTAAQIASCAAMVASSRRFSLAARSAALLRARAGALAARRSKALRASEIGAVASRIADMAATSPSLFGNVGGNLEVLADEPLEAAFGQKAP